MSARFHQGHNMKKNTFKRRFITLIEMMIVMFLIAMITGVIAYNYRGSLDEGKAFKTRTGIDKLETILVLQFAENPNQDISGWENMVDTSPLVQNADALKKDGWGEKYAVSRENDGKISITSKRYEEYLGKTKGTMFGKTEDKNNH